MSYDSHKYYNGNLYASITKDVKKQQLNLYAGIAMDVKKSIIIYKTYMWVLHI
jgi:hypothetical protein